MGLGLGSGLGLGWAKDKYIRWRDGRYLHKGLLDRRNIDHHTCWLLGKHMTCRVPGCKERCILCHELLYTRYVLNGNKTHAWHNIGRHLYEPGRSRVG